MRSGRSRRRASIQKEMRAGNKFLVAAPPDGRALWLRHDGSAIHLMASTCFIPAGLVLPVDDCFEVRILRVDREAKCLYVRPLCNDEQYDQMNVSLTAATSDDAQSSCCNAVSQPLNMSTVYLIKTEKGYRRAALLKRGQSSACVMYGIDVGEVYDVNVSDVRELLPSLRAVPPLCFCIVLNSCSNSSNEFPSDYPQRAKEMYPPAIMSQMFEKNEQGKFVEISCTMKVVEKTPKPPPGLADEAGFSRILGSSTTTVSASMVSDACVNKKSSNKNSGMPRRRSRALVVKSASVPAISRDPSLPFMFQKFNVSLPAHLRARVTERIDYDTYLMRNPEVLDELEKHLTIASTPLAPRSCFDRGICCMARLIRPARANCSTFQPQLYRAIASHFRPEDNTCEVVLIDFGQVLVCSVLDLFELRDQPAEVLDTPASSFRCRVKKFSCSAKKNGSKAIKLLDEHDYNVCLTLKCARDSYWAKVTLSGTDFVLYYKKPRVRKEFEEKIPNEDAGSAETQPQINGNTPSSSELGGKLERRKEELREEEERLLEQERKLKKEKENFANEKIKREQELQMMALQMQLWDISAKLDLVTSSNGFPGFVRANSFNPQLQQGNYCAPPMCVFNGCDQPGITYGNGSTGISHQQQQNTALNQSTGLQWPYYLSAPPASGPAAPVEPGIQQYQQMVIPSSMRSSTPFAPNISTLPYANTQNDYQCGAAKYTRNLNGNVSPQKWRSSKKWNFPAPPPPPPPPLIETSCAMLASDTSSDSSSAQPITSFLRKNEKKTHSTTARLGPRSPPKAAFPTSRTTSSMISNSSTECKASASAESFWDTCHRKLEYGEPPHRTISDYCNTAIKQTKQTSTRDLQINFPVRSLSAVLQYDRNLLKVSNRPVPELKLKSGVTSVGEAVSSTSRMESNRKAVYTSDESTDGSQVCGSLSQQDELFVTPQHQLSLHFDSELPPLPNYRMLHEFISIADDSELLVQRVGSDSDWPVFFVTPNAALQDMSMEYFDSLHPTRKLNANEIEIGILCAVRCGILGKTKVRAVVEHFSEKVVEVRHIDHGHMETVRPNELWSVENLPSTIRTHPALAIPCILSPLSEITQLNGAVRCGMNEVPCVGQLLRVLFKTRRQSDGIWVVELLGNEMMKNGGATTE